MEYLYVCLFSNGHIKVGRSTDPSARIAAHADRVACLGVELADQFTIFCVGAASSAEALLINRCRDRASQRNHNEWFVGLMFQEVCDWAKDCALLPLVRPEATRLRQYLDQLPQGGINELAGLLGISNVYLHQLACRLDGREPSPILCVAIERATREEVMRWHLRPDDWRLIWPELAERAEAPEFPAPTAPNGGTSPPPGAASGPPA